eukprot:3014675-Pyramimonas_sp.AAC.1
MRMIYIFFQYALAGPDLPNCQADGDGDGVLMRHAWDRALQGLRADSPAHPLDDPDPQCVLDLAESAQPKKIMSASAHGL